MGGEREGVWGKLRAAAAAAAAAANAGRRERSKKMLFLLVLLSSLSSFPPSLFGVRLWSERKNILIS